MRFGRLLGTLAAAAITSASFAGCSGGVVGGECREGLSRCGQHCLNLQVDDENCGACGITCDPGESCVKGMCSTAGDGSVNEGDASRGGSAGVGGSHSGGAAGAGGTGAGGQGGTGGVGAGGSDAGAGGTGGVLVDAGTGGSTLDAGDASLGAGGTGTGGASSGGAGGTASGGTAGGGGTGTGGTGTGGAGTGGTDAGPPCEGPLDVPEQCGSCDVQCTGLTSVCSPGNDGYHCVSKCTAPLIQCGSQCVNTDIDENNCGKCNHRCASQICQAGQCVGATAGHEVELCMDFRTQAVVGSPQQRLLGNAVFIPLVEPVRVLGYSQWTSAANVTAVGKTLDAAATARNRTYVVTQAKTPLDVTNALNVVDYDVLLVYDQPGATAGTLSTTGTTFHDPISSFVRAGGTVVVLAGDGGRAEMPDLMRAAGLLDASAQTGVTNNLLYNRALGDAVGLNVLSQFRAVRETCTFTIGTADPAATYVITDQPASTGNLGAPAVVHTVVAP